MDTKTISNYSIQKPEFIEEFKKLVQQWISYDDDIRKLKEAEKKINEAKKALTEPILQFMSKNSIEDCNTSTGKLKYCVSLHKKPISKQFLVDKLTIYLNNGKYKFIHIKCCVNQ